MLSRHIQKLGSSIILGWLGIFVLVAIIAMLAGSCQPSPALHYARSIQEQHTESVSITALCVADDGSAITMFIASGTRISRTQVLTAAHVTHAPPGMTCMWMGQQLGQDKGLMLMPSVVDEPRDLAMMSTQFAEYSEPALYTIGAKPLLGESICEVSANPYHIRRCGEVQLGHTEYPTMIDSTMIVEPGNSGSPATAAARCTTSVASSWVS